MSDFEELDERDRALAQRLRTQLRASEELDYVTQAKLSAARARALGAAPRHTGWWVATGGLTAAALLAVVLVLHAPHPVAPTSADALELLTDDVEPEFYQDLDMYKWLAEPEQAVLEALVMAAAQATAPPPTTKPAPPPADLIEFLGNWTDDEASLIDEAKPPSKATPPSDPGVAGKEKRGMHK